VCGFVVYAENNGANKGIHGIGTQAVYIAGEACVINAGISRTVEEMRSDFENCAIAHFGFKNMQITEVTKDLAGLTP
jgi:hypothetical protein